MTDIKLLKSEEKAIFSLRALYKKYGYLPFKMRKFEDYELYVKNKDFLVSDRIITFNDTGGRLLALKPDVTLSIIKNGEDIKGFKQKVYYNENVYRVSKNTGHFKEIMQSGIECIGDIDMYDTFEVLSLAAKSLETISEEYYIEISHLGILSSLLYSACQNENFIKKATKYIAEKNAHDLKRACEEYGVPLEKADRLCSLVNIYGERKEVLKKLEEICLDEQSKKALNELVSLSNLLDCCEEKDKIQFDFSLVNDMNYYDGIVFKGFLSGICQSILSGGEYGKLLKKFSRSSRAIGFAIYLDLLEDMEQKEEKTDIDTLVLYDDSTDKDKVAQIIREIVYNGKSVSAQKTEKGLRYRNLIDLR